jgi:2-iminobutanoate/2-iminopropanoate deaminase
MKEKRLPPQKIINPVEGALLHDPERVGGWHNAAIRAGNYIFLSGVVGAYPGTRKLGETIEKQVRLIFDNADEALRAHGASITDVVRMTMYFTDRDHTWPILEKVRREIFLTAPPTSTGVGVTKLDLDAALEIEMIAVVPDDD